MSPGGGLKRSLRSILRHTTPVIVRHQQVSSRSLQTRRSDQAICDFGTRSAVDRGPGAESRRQHSLRVLSSTGDDRGQGSRDSSANAVIIACTAASAAAAAAAAAGAGARDSTSCAPIDPKRRFHDIYYQSSKAPLLGSGSFGSVSTAIHQTTGEIVAVKKIPRERDVSFEDISWEVEVLKLAGEHRNITQFYDVFQDDDFYYLTMEMANGGELFDLLVEQGIPAEEEAATLMRALLGAVAFVHMHGIIHGDIKPENVFLTNSRYGEVDWQDVRLGDFGSSVEVALGGRTTLDGLHTRGTVAYNPPESLQRMREKKDVVLSPRGDVWALGVVLFMLLTGEHPFAPDMSVSDEEMAEQVLNESDTVLFPDENPKEFAQASEEQREEWVMRTSLSPEARDMIKKMLERDPEKRATADELLGHPWLLNAPPNDGTAGRRVSALGRSDMRLRPWSADAETTHVTSEVLQRFWSARQKVKALMLALMSGLVDGVLPDIAEEGEDSDRRLVEAERGKTSSSPVEVTRGRGSLAEKGGKWRTWPWKGARKREEFHASATALPSRRHSRPDSFDFPLPGEQDEVTVSADSVDPEAMSAFIKEVEEEREEKKRELEAARKELAQATAEAIALTDGGMAETICAAHRVSVATSIVEDLEKELERPLAEMVKAAVVRAADPSKRRRPPYPVGSREVACAVLDRDGKGFITADDISRTANLLGDTVSQSEVRDMMAAMDGDPSTEAERLPYDEVVKVIPPLCPPITFDVGKKLYREGDLDPSFYLLTKGVVEFSVSVLQGKAPLQRQGPGASFGEVELLRADGTTAPRLATCRCVGENKGGENKGCEVLVVSGHMFELLTDVFDGIRMKLVDQVESRLTQLAGSVLRNAFDGQETSMMGLDVIWGEKESTLVWNSVKPLRKKRPPPPFPAASEIFSKPPPAPAPAPAAPSPVTVDVSAKGGPGISAENGVAAVNKAAAVASAAVSQAYVALASSSAMGGVSTSSIDEGASSMDNSSSSIGSVSGGSSSVSTAAVGREENVAVNSSEHIGKGELGEEAAAVTMGGSGHGSFVLLVLEGSLTAIYGDEAVEEARERVLEPGDFCFCGDGFGPDAPESPNLVTCKLWQRARVLRVPAPEFLRLMKKETMAALIEFMYTEG